MKNEPQLKSVIFNIIAKFDNGSHSSSQLEAADEELYNLFLTHHRQAFEKVAKKMEGLKWEDISEDTEKFDKENRIANYTHNTTLDDALAIIREEI